MNEQNEQVDAEGNPTQGRMSFKETILAMRQWVRREFVWALLVLPVISSAVVYLLSAEDVNGWSDDDKFKVVMEILHPSLIAVFLIVSWGRWITTRATEFAFLGTLSAFVLCREMVGQGSSIVLYAGLVMLFVYAMRNAEKLRGLFPSRWAASFLLMCFICYAFSQLLDRGAIKRIGWLLLWDTSWKVPFSSNFEEALESLGGFFLMLSPWVVSRKRKESATGNAESSIEN
jgi:hypothetical protein